MTQILKVSDIRFSGQCIDGIAAQWDSHVPAEWGTYAHCLRHGVPLTIAEKSTNPVIMDGVRVARARYARRTARLGTPADV